MTTLSHNKSIICKMTEASNGKKHTVVGVVSYRIVNGKIVEAWVVEDTLDSLKQLGLIEYTEKGRETFSKEV